MCTPQRIQPARLAFCENSGRNQYSDHVYRDMRKDASDEVLGQNEKRAKNQAGPEYREQLAQSPPDMGAHKYRKRD